MVGSHMTVTGAPLSVFVRISLTTMAFAVGMNVFVSRSWDNMVVRIAED